MVAHAIEGNGNGLALGFGADHISAAGADQHSGPLPVSQELLGVLNDIGGQRHIIPLGIELVGFINHFVSSLA